MRLVQFTDVDASRKVAMVGGDNIHVTPLRRFSTSYELAMAAIAQGVDLATFCASQELSEPVSYDEIISSKRLLAPLDHPEPARFWVTGTGLTHVGSADARDKMHVLEHGADTNLSDSMKIFKMGLEGGKPADGKAGVQPEWFFKGVGTCVVPPEAELELPAFAMAGGEEAEIVGLYVIGPDGSPWRVGFAIGNEFSDQVTEAQNYLYLAHSKLRQCSIGPELLVGDLPEHVEGVVRVMRDGAELWSGPFLSGEGNMSHSIANLEHYHFRYDAFRRPGDVHAYFVGAAILSCANGVTTRSGDSFEIDVPAFGRPLRNKMVRVEARPFQVRQL
ncbi:MAG: FAH family protein [Pelagibacterium sp. SCN 64-44]|nr:MAG: FAH family protein [Pelagibacterium sp. SCN 64-44]